MKKINKILIISLFSLLFVGCSKGNRADYAPSYDYAGLENNSNDVSNKNDVVVDTNRKITYTVNYTIRSKDINPLKQAINSKNIELEGFVSYSKEQSNSAQVTYRVPVSHLNELLDFIDSLEGVGDKTINQNDITSSYSYTSARISVLQASRTSYINLLSHATTIADIIALQDKIDAIDTELTNLQQQMDTYNDKLDYATVNVYYNTTYTYEEPGFFDEYWDYLGNLFISIGEFILYALPIIVVVGGIFCAIFFPVRHSVRKKRTK